MYRKKKIHGIFIYRYLNFTKFVRSIKLQSLMFHYTNIYLRKANGIITGI